MCGRFALSIVGSELGDVLGVEPPPEYRPSWNITPDRKILIVRSGREGRQAVLARWGFLGPWMNDANDPGRQINARLETAPQKPMFKAAFAKGRCIVPADGFFEWQKQPKGPSRPFFVRPAGHTLMLMAGLWRRNRLADGTLIDTVAILTRRADRMLEAIHPRMPALVPDRLVEPWLVADPPSTKLIEELLSGAPDATPLEIHEVGRAVNDPRNDFPSLLEPVDPMDPAPRLL